MLVVGLKLTHCVKSVQIYGVFSGPYFPVFGLNTARYGVSLHILSECGKIQTRKNSVFGHFSYPSVFSPNAGKYGPEKTPYSDTFRIFPYSVRMRENTDQKKLRIWTLFTQ